MNFIEKTRNRVHFAGAVCEYLLIALVLWCGSRVGHKHNMYAARISDKNSGQLQERKLRKCIEVEKI